MQYVAVMVWLLIVAGAAADQPGTGKRSPIMEFFVEPVRVVWQSE